MRGAGAHAVARRAVLRRGDDPRIGGEAQVVVAAEVQHLAAVDGQLRALARGDRVAAPAEAGGGARGAGRAARFQRARA